MCCFVFGELVVMVCLCVLNLVVFGLSLDWCDLFGLRFGCLGGFVGLVCCLIVWVCCGLV